MPYGLLTPSPLHAKWETHLGYDSSIDGSTFGFWCWETICEIAPKLGVDGPSPKRSFENVWVLEGVRGIFMSTAQATARGIPAVIGQIVGVKLATYLSPQVGVPTLPDSTVDLFLPLRLDSENTLPLGEEDLDDVCVIGLADILSHFDILDSSGSRIYPDAVGDIETFQKNSFIGLDIPILKSESSDKVCVKV
ncbi:MAG: hypothetical protein SGI77_17660 [Pirellulaceae bacterium]|nr:hypothetical protein [Pirellulaceae bacterium]